VEALGLFVVGVAMAFIANWISPRGLSLTRNYFPRPGGLGAESGPGLRTNATTPAFETGTVVEGGNAAVAARLKENGLQVIDRAGVETSFRDPQYEQELIVFIDARDDRHYQEGHIPGAYQFDRYYPEKHLGTVLPACLNATKVVVYCSGGKCEDSEFAALALKDAGVPLDRLSVFIGGIAEWSANRLPLELGGRKSGRWQEERQ
jgi:rhodanese-related sulfurtransferase